MFPTLETKDPGTDTLQGNKRTCHIAVWSLRLGSNFTKHSRAAEEIDRPNPLPIAGKQASFQRRYLPPNSALALILYVRTNLTRAGQLPHRISTGCHTAQFPPPPRDGPTFWSGQRKKKCTYSQLLTKQAER